MTLFANSNIRQCLQGTTGFIKCVILSELHVKPIVNCQRIRILAAALCYLVIPQRREVKHFLFSKHHMVARSVLELAESLHVLCQIWIWQNPWHCPSCLLAGETAVAVWLFCWFEISLLQIQNGYWRKQRKMLFAAQGHVEILIRILMQGGDRLIVPKPNILRIRMSTLEETLWNMTEHFLRQFCV